MEKGAQAAEKSGHHPHLPRKLLSIRSSIGGVSEQSDDARSIRKFIRVDTNGRGEQRHVSGRASPRATRVTRTRNPVPFPYRLAEIQVGLRQAYLAIDDYLQALRFSY